MQNLGARVYGLAAIMLGIAGLIWDEFTMEWLVPAKMPGHSALAYAVSALLIVGGILINVGRTAAWGAGLLAVLSAIGVAFGLRGVAMHPLVFDYWDPFSEYVATTAAAVIAYAMIAEIEPRLSSRIQLAGRIVFGLCLFFFATAHFYWLQNTASLVPKWLPPSQMFWAYATAFAAIAAGLAIVSGVMALLAARLLTLMYIIFGVLVHTPLVIADPANHFKVEEFMVNLMLVGAAWIVAEFDRGPPTQLGFLDILCSKVHHGDHHKAMVASDQMQTWSQSFMRWCLLVLLCAGFAIWIARPAHAQIIVRPGVGELMSCSDDHLYNSRSADAPALIANSFQSHASVLTFRTCADMKKNTHYFIRKPRPNRNGICRIFEAEVFPGTAQDFVIVDTLYDGTAPGWYFDMPGWKNSPPDDWTKLQYRPREQVFAQRANGQCPPGDDEHYVTIVGTMTDGMLKAFFDLWHDISGSPETFDKAFANTTSVAYIHEHINEDHDALVRGLRSDLFGKDRRRPVLETIECDLGNLSGCSPFFDGYIVGFDVTDHGLEITRIDEVMYI